MSEKPSSVIITCQNCKKHRSPTEILRSRGQCASCPTAKWHLHAEFGGVRNGSSSPLSTDGALLANIGLNAIGVGLLVATGTGFTVRVGGGMGSDQTPGGKSVADIYDVPSEKVLELCDPANRALSRLGEFVLQQEAEIQRTRMKERGGSHCRSCQILFVPSPAKPWTLVGACSKSCCADMSGVAEYSLIENAVIAATSETSTKIEQAATSQAYIQVSCTCGQTIQFAKMYKGTYRKCTNCQAKILVPLTG